MSTETINENTSAAREVVAPLSPEMHGLRGVLALWVVVHHTSAAICELTRVGYFAVDAFFVLSGYAIAASHALEMRQLRPAVVGRYLWLRVVRIWPMLIASVGLTAIWATLATGRPPKIGEAVSYLFLMGWDIGPRHIANSPLWSLRTEVAAYLAFPLVAAGLVRSSSSVVLFVLAVATLGNVIFLTVQPFPIFGAPSVVRTLLGFVCGCCVALAMKRFPDKRSDVIAFVSIAAIALVVAAGIGMAWAIPFVPSLVAASAAPGRWGRLLLDSAPCRFLGRISFPIYVIHWPIMCSVKMALGGFPGGGPIGTGLTIGLSAAIASVLEAKWERPLRRALRGVWRRPALMAAINRAA